MVLELYFREPVEKQSVKRLLDLPWPKVEMGKHRRKDRKQVR